MMKSDTIFLDKVKSFFAKFFFYDKYSPFCI